MGTPSKKNNLHDLRSRHGYIQSTKFRSNPHIYVRTDVSFPHLPFFVPSKRGTPGSSVSDERLKIAFVRRANGDNVPHFISTIDRLIRLVLES